MARVDEYKTVAEIYRNREHAVLKYIQRYINDNDLTLDDLEHFLKVHLSATGRNPDSPLDTPPLTLVDQDVRTKLLAFLAPSGAELEASTVKVRTRKVRSDKGKKRTVKV